MKTLLTETKWCRFEPSDDLLNPYLQIITHKEKPVLADMMNPNKQMKRSLSALLNSKKTDPLIDDDPSFMNNLHAFEGRNVQTVSSKAPNKNQRPFSSLRQGRDPRTQGKRMRRPFLTYEKAPLNNPEQVRYDRKMCHMKVMTERVQNYNKVNFVPKSKQAGTDAPLPQELSGSELHTFKKTAEFAAEAAAIDSSFHVISSTEPLKDENPQMASKIMENLQGSICKDIVNNMSVHDQMKLIHNVMENEEFKKEQRQSKKRADELEKEKAEEIAKLIEPDLSLSLGCWGDDCVCSIGDEASAREHQKKKKSEKHTLETEEAAKKIFKAKKIDESPVVSIHSKTEWQTAEEYIPGSFKESAPSKSVKSDDKENKNDNIEAKFYNRESLGNLDDAKKKLPVLTFGKKPSEKSESTLQSGKWEKAVPFKPSSNDANKIEKFQDLKRKRHEKEMDLVKKMAEGNGAFSPANQPSMGNYTNGN